MSGPPRNPAEAPVEEHPFLAGLEPGFLRSLGALARPRSFATGEHVVRDAAPAEAMYLVRAGKVALEVESPGKPQLTVQTVGPGEVLGWSWLVPPYRWHFDARALKATSTWAIEAPGLRALLDAQPEQGYRFLLRLLPVIGERLEHTRIQLLDIYAP